MQAEEKSLIDGLFSRLRDAEVQSAPREPQAEALIREHLSRQPAAPYYMAQAIIVQENALQQLDARVKELEPQIETLNVSTPTRAPRSRSRSRAAAASCPGCSAAGAASRRRNRCRRPASRRAPAGTSRRRATAMA